MVNSGLSKWRLDKLPGLAICLCLGALLAVMLRQDATWDMENYHLYNAWALLNDRYTRDIVPAGMQSYFNPLLDLPYFFLSTGLLEHWPRALAALQGLWFGALCFMVLRIAFRLAEYQDRKPHWADMIAVAIGVSGTMAVSQTGITTNEVPLAVFVLLSFYLLMPMFRGDSKTPLRAVFMAGLSGGFAAGMKSTAIIYPPALGLALFLMPATPGLRVKCAAIFSASAALAFLLAYGWWGWHLYRLSGNPVFPMFNQIFRSDLISPMNTIDLRFMPRSWAQWTFYPFYWIRKHANVVTEAPFADPRYTLAMLSMLFIAVSAALRSRHGKDTDGAAIHPASSFIAAFVSLSYLFWLILFSILRYAIAIEAMTGIVMLIAVQAAIRFSLNHREHLKTAGLCMGILLLLIAATTHYPNWGRIKFGQQVFAITPGEIRPGSLVLLGGAPSAYIIPFFPNARQIDFIGLNWFVRASNGHRLWNRIQQRLAEQKDPLYVVLRRDDKDDLDLLHNLAPDLTVANCQPIPSNFDQGQNGSTDLRLCLGHRIQN